MQDALITVANGRIRAVGPWQGGPVVHDLSRYTVLPGLIDAHVHIGGYFNRFGRLHSEDDGETSAQQAAGRAAGALATLHGGFTTVASMGSENDRALRDRINAGFIPGPRILSSLGSVRDSSLTPDQLRRSVRRSRATGSDFIKIFASNAVRNGGVPVFTDEQLSALCGEATRLRLRSAIHAQSDASIRQAAAAGCNEVEHGFLGTAEGLRVLAASGAFFVPQCGLLFRNYLANRARFAGLTGYDSIGFSLMERMLPGLPALLRSAAAVKGLELLYGTDATAGAHGRNAEDLVCWVREAGQSPMDVLVTATSRNASALGLGTEIGAIASGYQADLIALDGNPLEHIEAVLRVRFVMKGGKAVLKP